MIAQATADTIQTQSRKTRRPPSCSFCKKTGHNRSSCETMKSALRKRDLFMSTVESTYIIIINEFYRTGWDYDHDENLVSMSAEHMSFMDGYFPILVENRDQPNLALEMVIQKIANKYFETESDKEYFKKFYRNTYIDHKILYDHDFTRKSSKIIKDLIFYLQNTSDENCHFDKFLCTITNQPRLEKLNALKNAMRENITSQVNDARNECERVFDKKIHDCKVTIRFLQESLRKATHDLDSLLEERTETFDLLARSEQRLEQELNSIFNTTCPIHFEQKAMATNIDTECPICYDEINPVRMIETNCNHRCCMTCMLNITCPTANLSEIPCPCCRTNITKLSGDVQEMLNAVQQYRHKYRVNNVISGLGL